MMKILLADDESMVRSALCLLIEQNLELHVIGEVTAINELVAAINTLRPDILLLDGELPGADIKILLPELRARWPNLTLIIMSGRVESKWVALRAGADAFISKGDPPDRLVAILDYYLCSSFV